MVHKLILIFFSFAFPFASHPLYISPVPPQIMHFQFGDDSFNPGDSTAVNCMISKGDTPLTVKWTLNGQPVVNGENGVQVVKMSARLSSLSIESLSDRHRGMFRCIASNVAGEVSYSSELKINGTHSWRN